MYKVFYNEKALILSEKPISNLKNLAFNNEGQFEEALALLRNSSNTEVNIYHHNLNSLWENFKNHLEYLEAAGGLVQNQKKEILFIHRLDKWDLPKGKLEIGETPKIAAVREVEEECGISNLILKDLITITYHIYFQDNLKLKATYWYEMDYDGNEELIPQTEEGIGIAEWKNQSEIPQILQNTYENIKLVLEKIPLINQ
ncbi:NUDIX hydrolase [Moheibacter lacus]|uniref:NUDIX domain-containing protein n=1 Tax=Moheibacter lacus TaxID=2745851 RepID=A0A838ZSN0_9FLAO|nr:NUDIX domain-containing protein [Moheibacter lacus]MBA5629985.1 NUDIX domain-containing protein [Moheibacter lacus]